MSYNIIIKNNISSFVTDVSFWNVIQECIYKSFLSFINVHYNIKIIDEETGTLPYFNLTKLKSLIDKLETTPYDYSIWSQTIQEYTPYLTSLELDHILSLISISQQQDISILSSNNLKQLFSYCIPFIKQTSVLNNIYQIDDLLSSSIDNNLTTQFVTSH